MKVKFSYLQEQFKDYQVYLERIAHRHGLPVIEDSCQAIQGP